MRNFDDLSRRWKLLFEDSIGVDLRQSVREDDRPNPCEDGLRSVCWKAFLLYGPPSQSSWTKKQFESRSAYSSLRDHFLRYIDRPDDLDSSADPLADGDSSPWATLRQDESSREEIWQDVTRCMQENFFFREPTTQRSLLDILFIYAKLNPDTGYRQGMHELLAPILWVVSQDALDKQTLSGRDLADTELMKNTLDHDYVEHDAFNLFCAVMQTTKTFYELATNSDESPIIARSKRTHEEILAAVDPELADHLTRTGILPQIFVMRWIRLLFGREFDFNDVLQIWDFLLAEKLSFDVIDMTCVAMLLRVRWPLLEADYATATTILNRYDLPAPKNPPRSLVRDAVFLIRHRDTEGGAKIIKRYSGRLPGPWHRPQTPPQKGGHRRDLSRMTHVAQQQSSPARSPSRFTTPQRQLENLFQDVTRGVQQRAEGWNISKTIQGAVKEARRNINNLQTSQLIDPDSDLRPGASGEQSQEKDVVALERKLHKLQERNKALAKMLDDALHSLRNAQHTVKNVDTQDPGHEDFNLSLAKIQFVSVYLTDSEILIPEASLPEIEAAQEEPNAPPERILDEASNDQDTGNQKDAQQPKSSPRLSPSDTADSLPKYRGRTPATSQASKSQVRPSLADSSFSFMLGEGRHRSSFVSSVSDLPERSRPGSISDAVQTQRQLFSEQKRKNNKDHRAPEDDSVTLKRLTGD